jgi:hypothetical protein
MTTTALLACLFLVSQLCACAEDPQLWTSVQNGTVTVPLQCKVFPGNGPLTTNTCVPDDPVNVQSITFSPLSQLTNPLNLKFWQVKNPDGTPARMVAGCGLRDGTCTVLAEPRCIIGPELPGGQARNQPAVYRGQYGALNFVPFQDGEFGSASAEIPPGACVDDTSSGPLTAGIPVLPQIAVACVANGDAPNPGAGFCSPKTPKKDNRISYWIPNPPPGVRYVWEVLNGTIVSGCTANSPSCIIKAPASDCLDLTYGVGVTAIDTTWNTWTQASAEAYVKAVCGNVFC